MPIYLLNIVSWLETHQLPCMFKAVTHVDCPGCGFQRSFILLIKGDLQGSLYLYPALLPVIALFVLLLLHITARIRNGASVLKFAYIFCAGFILVSYIYKLIIIKTV